jgi:hypothetical protein
VSAFLPLRALRLSFLPFVSAFLFALPSPAVELSTNLAVTADVGLSSYVGKERQSNGAGPTTPLRQNQNWSGFESRTLLLDFDTAPVRGWTITRATLHLYLARGDLHGAGLCEVLAPWNEPATVNGQEEAGGPCWLFAHTPADPKQPHPGDWWAWPRSGFYSVAWAHPMARYSHAAPAQIVREPVAAAGETSARFTHLAIPVDPALVASLAAGTCHGFVLTDDKGQVAEARSLVGAGYPYRDNDAEDIYAFTREIQDPALRPRLEVLGELARADRPAPAAVTAARVARVEAGRSTVTLEFPAPSDAAGNDLLAYDVRHAPRDGAAWEDAAPLPRWAITRPAKAGQKQEFPVWTLPAGHHELLFRSVDFRGARGAVARIGVDVPSAPKAQLVPTLLRADDDVTVTLPPPQMHLSAVPDMAKVDPVTGGVLQDGEGYRSDPAALRTNAMLASGGRQVRLVAAANETVAFQLIVQRKVEKLTNVKISVSDLAGPNGRTIPANPNAQRFRLWYVPVDAKPASTGTADRCWYGDACLPLAAPFAETFDLPSADNAIPSQTIQSVWVDFFIPKGTPAGRYAGTIAATAAETDERSAVLSLAVDVLPLTLPDQPTWLVELNCYGGLAGFAGVNASAPAAPEAEWKFYQLAKAHRLMINALPYGQRGYVDTNRSPIVAGEGADVKVVDWSPLDRRLGPLLDGSAFTPERGYQAGPGAGTPISHIYLPFHENWPLPLATYYRDFAAFSNRLDFAAWAARSRPLEEAFSEEYKAGYAGVVRQFAEHARDKGWLGTTFQFFLNNKYYYKVPFFSATGSSRAGSSFWLLDESVDYDDYAANAFFLGLCRRGVEAAGTPVRFAYRADVSQPEMTRNLWNGLIDLWMCGFGAVSDGYATTAEVRRKWLPRERCWHYGGGAPVPAAAVNLSQAFLASWCADSDGILPYWSVLEGKDWSRANDLAVFYTGKNYAGSGRNYPGPLPGVRMKLLRRCQQDIELLQLLAVAPGWDRDRVRAALAAYADDPAAPALGFRGLTSTRLQQLRASLAATLQQAHAASPRP